MWDISRGWEGKSREDAMSKYSDALNIAFNHIDLGGECAFNHIDLGGI